MKVRGRAPGELGAEGPGRSRERRRAERRSGSGAQHPGRLGAEGPGRSRERQRAERRSGSGAQPPGRLGPRVRARRAVFDPGLVHLALADQGIVPDADELAGWIDQLAGGGAVHAIRTGALFAEAADRFADAGFAVVDTLMLLRADLSDPRVGRPRSRRDATLPLWSRHHDTAAVVDRAAFGQQWGNGPADLVEIRQATASHRARARRAVTTPPARLLSRAPIVAFAISGAAGGQGYLQRLAVLPQHQRQGHGRALTVDSLAWMRRRHLRHAVVNTGIDNEPARALYESLGFRVIPDRLVVMQLEFSPEQ